VSLLTPTVSSRFLLDALFQQRTRRWRRYCGLPRVAHLPEVVPMLLDVLGCLLVGCGHDAATRLLS